MPERKRQFAEPPLHPIRFDVRGFDDMAPVQDALSPDVNTPSMPRS
jgi:hypothetical protein